MCNKIILSICILALTCGAISCKKLIDINPPANTVGNEAAFSTNAIAESTVAGLYSQLMNNTGVMNFANGATTIYAGLASGELEGFAGSSNSEDWMFTTSTINLLTSTPNAGFWQPAYQIIFGANSIIENLAKPNTQLDDTTRVKLTGECKFLRAFCYFYLTNFFGDVPQPLVSDFNQTIKLGRAPQEKIYTQIIQDLKDAKQALPADYSAGAGERIRANKMAATALLARVYLYHKEWENAEAQADSVIMNSQYSIMPDLNAVFGVNTAESILQFKQANTTAPYNATWEGTNLAPYFRWSQQTPESQALFLQIFADAYSYLIPIYTLSNETAQIYEPGDKRRTTWIDSTLTPDDTIYHGRAYYFVEKYTTQQGSPGGETPQYYTVLRLAEQYLIRAEARAWRNNLGGAAEDLNIIRTRAGLTATTAATQGQLLDAVALERRREFAGEWGHYYLDLKRTGKATGVLGALPAKQPFDPNQLLWPIPKQEITNDPALIQNPGYN